MQHGLKSVTVLKEALLTLRSLWSSGYQVVLSYDEQSASRHKELWPAIPYLWANKPNAEELIYYLECQKRLGRPGEKSFCLLRLGGKKDGSSYLWSLNRIFLFHRGVFCSRPEFNDRPMLHRLTSSGYSPNSDHGELEPCEEMARRSETRSWTHMSKHNSRRLHWSCTVLFACHCSQQKTALKSCWSKMGLYVKSLLHGKALFKDSFGSQTQGLQT